MTAQEEEKFLPKEPLDLPKEPLDLPREPEEITKRSTAGGAPHVAPRHEQADAAGVKTLLAWSAPGRPFKKRKKEFFLNCLLIALLFEIIFFLFAQYLVMLLIASLVFAVFALAITPPHNFHYRISSEGVTVEDHFSLWQELYDFYFKKRDGVEVLHIRTQALIPGELLLPLGDLHKEHVKNVLLPYLPYREFVKPTFMEKSADWLARNFPLEKT